MATTTPILSLIKPATGDGPSELRIAINNNADAVDGAVLTGDPRLLSAALQAALAGTSGTPGSANKFVTHDDIGAGVQAHDATLDALAGVTTAANKLIYATGVDAFATSDLTAAGRALIDDADAAAQRTTLGAAPATGIAYSALTLADAIKYSDLAKDANGPLQGAFSAYNAGGGAFANNGRITVTFATEEYDYGNNFNTSTFTAPVKGVYEFMVQLAMGGVLTGSTYSIELYKNGATTYIIGSGAFTSDDVSVIPPLRRGSRHLLLNAGDTVVVRLFTSSSNGGAGLVGAQPESNFQGKLIGRAS